MAEDSAAATYRRRWKDADQRRLESWLTQPTELPPPASTEPLGPPTPEQPASPGFLGTVGAGLSRIATPGGVGRYLAPGGTAAIAADVQAVKTGASAFWETFQAGAQNVADAIYAKAPQEALPKLGQGLIGALGIASSLPAGVGGIVREAINQYTPGQEGAVMLPGGPNSPASYFNATMAVPSFLDPKMRQAMRDNPQALQQALDEPVTYGQFFDVLTQFVVGAMPLGALRRGGRGAPGETFKPVTGEIVEPAALGAAPEGAPGPQALPAHVPGQPIPGQAALPEVGTPAAKPPLVTPPPMTPRDVAIHLRTTLEDIPKPKAAGEAAAAAPEAPTLPATVERTLTRSEEVIRQELDAADVAEVVAKAGPEEVGRAAPEGAAAVTPEAVPTPEGAAPTAEAGAGPISRFKASTVVEDHLLEITRTLQHARQGEPFVIKVGHDGTWRGVGKPEAPKMDAPPPDFYEIKIAGGRFTSKGTVTQRMRDWVRGEGGGADPALLARMAIGAAAGGTQGDTPEERILNAFLGMGLGAAVSKRLAVKLKDAYKESGLSDETGAIDFSKWSKKPSVQPDEASFQPNYQHIISTPQVRALSINLHRAIKDQILTRGGPPKSHAATELAAERLIQTDKMTPERILTLEPEAVLNREELVAARMVGARALEDLYASRELYKAGKMTEAEWEDRGAVTAAIAENVRVAVKRTGQAFEGMKIDVGDKTVGTYRPEDVIHLARDFRGQGRAFAEALDRAENPAQTAKVLTTAAVFPRAFTEFMYFAYLSGKSALRNTAGIALMVPDAIAVTQIAPFMPKGFPGVTSKANWARPGMEIGAATQMAVGFGEGLIDAFRLLKLWDAPTRSELVNLPERFGPGQRQVEMHHLPAITAENFHATGPLGTAIDFMGKGMRAFPETLNVTDALGKSVNARMWQRVEAMRQATEEGHIDAAYMKRVDDLMNDWTLFDSSARERIMDFAATQTLTKDFQGAFLQRMQRGPENPWLQMVYRGALVPFFRTMMRGTEATFLRTPGLNLLMPQFWRDMKAGGREAQVAYARLAYGSMAMALFGYLESQGDITGDIPDDPDMRELWRQNGYQEQSWYNPVLGKYHSYANLGPITDLIRFGANMSMALRRRAADPVEAFLTGAAVIATTFDTKSHTQSVQDFLDMLRAGYNQSKIDAIYEFIRKKGAGLVPAVLREVESGVDPTLRRQRPAGHGFTAELDTFWRQVKAKIPGWSTKLDAEGHPVAPPDLNAFTGEEIIGETWPFAPFLTSTPKSHPVIDEVGRLRGAGLQMLPPSFLGGAVAEGETGLTAELPEAEPVIGGARLLPWQRHRFQKIMTQEAKNADGQTYMEALTAAIQTEDYKAASKIGPSGTPRDSGQALALRRIEREFMGMAEAQLGVEVPGIPQEIQRRREERKVRSAPTAQQPDIRQLLQGLTR